jgi:hypothetical protein
MALIGGAYLAVAVNLLASALAGITMLSYLLIYTPLKRKSPICTLIGALAGAMPPLIGWAGATGSLSSGAWILYAILFLWQFPHFMAIAWLYRDDYERAGYCVLPPPDRRDAYVNWMTIVPLVALIPLSIVPSLSGNIGTVYTIAKPGSRGAIIPANVVSAINFYQTGGPLHGLSEIVAEDPKQTTILGNILMTYEDRPIDCSNYSWYVRVFNRPHHEIENDFRVWDRAASLIDSNLSETTLRVQTPSPSGSPMFGYLRRGFQRQFVVIDQRAVGSDQ